LIFQEQRDLEGACAKHDAVMIQRNEEVRQLKEQVEELMDLASTM
jgi:hypothetical protein